MSEVETKVGKAVKRTVGVTIIVEPPAHMARYYGGRANERLHREIEVWAKEFNEWLHDHRSQDTVIVRTERDIREFCTVCNRELERDHDDDDDRDHCAWCGAVIEKGGD